MEIAFPSSQSVGEEGPDIGSILNHVEEAINGQAPASPRAWKRWSAPKTWGKTLQGRQLAGLGRTG